MCLSILHSRLIQILGKGTPGPCDGQFACYQIIWMSVQPRRSGHALQAVVRSFTFSSLFLLNTAGSPTHSGKHLLMTFCNAGLDVRYRLQSVSIIVDAIGCMACELYTRLLSSSRSF